MASYTLTGSGVQVLTASTVALRVTITVLAAGSGYGGANPSDYYGIGFLRPGDASSFWEPFPIVGGPQWMPVPWGTTRVGYAIAPGNTITLAEVFSPAPLAFPLSTLPDVALSSPADAQVLTYQGSSGKWINATPSGGGGGTTGVAARIKRTSAQSISGGSWQVVTWQATEYDTGTLWGGTGSNPTRLTCHTAGVYDVGVQGAFSTAVSQAGMKILVNGSTSICEREGASQYSQLLHSQWSFAVNDYIEAFVFASASTNLSPDVDHPCAFWMRS